MTAATLDPVDEDLLAFYVEYALECIAGGVSLLPPDALQALVLAILTRNP